MANNFIISSAPLITNIFTFSFAPKIKNYISFTPVNILPGTYDINNENEEEIINLRNGWVFISK